MALFTRYHMLELTVPDAVIGCLLAPNFRANDPNVFERMCAANPTGNVMLLDKHGFVLIRSIIIRAMI